MNPFQSKSGSDLLGIVEEDCGQSLDEIEDLLSQMSVEGTHGKKRARTQFEAGNSNTPGSGNEETKMPEQRRQRTRGRRAGQEEAKI